jgi:hypothetical protein
LENKKKKFELGECGNECHQCWDCNGIRIAPVVEAGRSENQESKAKKKRKRKSSRPDWAT